MIIKDVVVLREAADDLTAGRIFYEQREPVLAITSGIV